MVKLGLAFDISTTNVGISFFDEEKNLLELKHLQLKPYKSIDESIRYLHKADIFKEYISNYIEYIGNEYKGKLSYIFIEEELFGSNNVHTANKLIQFNSICTYILYKETGIIPEKFSVHTIRKCMCPEFVTKKVIKKQLTEVLSFPKDIDKKQYIWEKVNKLYPKIEWLYGKKNSFKKENYDMSDSVAVMYAGLLLNSQ